MAVVFSFNHVLQFVNDYLNIAPNYLKKGFIILCVLFASNTLLSQTHNINIVTWNLYMRPRLVMHNNQIERAHEIVKAILNDTIDIIVFQEIFDRKARKIIKKELESIYKYSAGPGKKGILRLNCGVMILSKYEILKNELVYFSDCKSYDCIAKKAVVFSEIKISESKTINIVGTHLQSIDGVEYSNIRATQIESVQQLMRKYTQPNIPLIYAGDFNIATTDSLFQKMTSTFHSKQSDLESTLKFTSDSDNTYKIGETDKSLIDHIFLDKNGTNATLINYKIIRKQYRRKNKNLNDLSDHYLVKATLKF